MSKTNLTKQNIGLASKLLRIEEQKAAAKKAKKLEEAGTPTTALPPESNATRQMQADVAAASNKSGVPAPVGAEPKADHGETAMGTQNPQGEDNPVKGANYAQGGEQDGMVRPPDQRGSGGEGPGDDTTGQNATSGIKPKKTMEDILKLDGTELIEAFIEFCGGVDEAIFKLLAEGVSLVEAESALVDKSVAEGLFDKAKAGIKSVIGGGEKKPTAGYLQHLQKRREAGSSLSGRQHMKFMKSDKPAAGWESSRKAGHDARRNK